MILMKSSLLGFLLSILLSNTALAQSQDSELMIDWDWRYVLSLRSVPDELEILEYQMKNVNEVIYKQVDRLQKQMLAANDVYRWDHKRSISQETFDRLQKEFAENIIAGLSNAILPHQLKRLNELAYWATVNNASGYSKSIVDGPLGRICDVDKSQQKDISKTASLLQDEFDASFFELRQKYRKQLLKRLNPSQQKKFDKITGPPVSIGLFQLNF